MDPHAAVADWLARFEAASASDLESLFAPDCHWRDVLALTWRIETVSSPDAVVAALQERLTAARPKNFRVDAARVPPRRVKRAGRDAIEAFFRFEAADGEGEGVVRLVANARGKSQTWTLLTALASLRGHEENLGKAHLGEKAYARDFRGPNWLDQRRATAAYEDRDPTVLVVGGGHAGLSIAARLTQLRVDTLIVDREALIGDNWRKRYHALTLHNQVHVNHLPYMPFPPNWPTYIPKDKLAGWFEAYVEAMELNFWTGTDFLGGQYDEMAGHWKARLRCADGTERTMRPAHIVMATGVSGIPSLPDIPSLENFDGKVLHASQYEDGEAWRDRRAIVIGTGNSGHDIAQDLHSSGARVTMVQRSPTLIVNIEPGAQLPYALYEEGPSLEECDLITAATPLALAKTSHKAFTEQARQFDRELLDGLERVGFRLDFGEDGTGWQFKYLTRGGGYYFNVGCSDLVAAGEIALVQFPDIDRFEPGGARLRDGRTVGADLVVLATGYKGQEHSVRRFFGDAIADRVGPIWGFGPDQELRNMFMRTAQPGLWFIAGSLAQCRIYSKYLALQIKALETGVLPDPAGQARPEPRHRRREAVGI